jgi:hypothetical protein
VSYSFPVKYREVVTFVDWCTTSCEVDTYFVDEPICLLADNIQNEVVTTYRSQVLKMLSVYMQTFLAPVEEVLIYSLKLFCRNICNFLMNIFI